MILCLDVGNSQIFAGVFQDEKLKVRFRRATTQKSSSDELGIFLKIACRENGIDVNDITEIAICSVVPHLDYSLRSACRKYFSITPFVLDYKSKMTLTLSYRNPAEIGADRIANAIAANHYFPQQNLIVVDFGTATTLCAISKHGEYMGGVILAGLRICMESLQMNTAKLSSVEIIKPTQTLGQSTEDGLQSGIYFSQLGAVKELVARLGKECFADEVPWVIGTGGFVHLFENEGIFNAIMTDLVLDGLRLSYLSNPITS